MDQSAVNSAEEYFALFQFKVEPCPQKNKHPWDSCSYCHPQENARRRDVRLCRYLAEACPDYKLNGFCVLGNECPFAHGVFEINLHPSKYRTQMCTEGFNCKRKICFFAHDEQQLRHPDYSYGYKNVTEAECVKEAILASRKMKAPVLHVRAGGVPAPPAHRQSPAQVAPATPPQGSPPRRGLVNTGGHDPASNLAAAFRMALPEVNALPTTNAVGLAQNSYVLPLLESNGDGWSDRSSFDVLPGRVSAEAGPLADRLPSGPAAMELAAGHTLAVGQAAAQLSRSLPTGMARADLVPDEGPRISMKVRRELGLEPPAKLRTHTPNPGAPAAMLAANVPGYNQTPPASPFPDEASTNVGLINQMTAALATPASMATLALGMAHGNTYSLGEVAPHLPALEPAYPQMNLSLGPPALTSPAGFFNNQGRIMVVSPNGTRITLEEAITQAGFISGTGAGSSVAGFTDLTNMATLLGNLGRLGYMLAGDQVSAGSKPTSETDPEDRGSSGKSTPTNLHSYHQQYAGIGIPAGALESFPLQLSLGQSTEGSQYAATQPAVLAGYGLNRTASGRRMYSLFN